MKTRLRALVLGVLSIAAITLVAPPADATGRCEVRIDRKTGDIYVVC